MSDTSEPCVAPVEDVGVGVIRCFVSCGGRPVCALAGFACDGNSGHADTETTCPEQVKHSTSLADHTGRSYMNLPSSVSMPGSILCVALVGKICAGFSVTPESHTRNNPDAKQASMCCPSGLHFTRRMLSSRLSALEELERLNASFLTLVFLPKDVASRPKLSEEISACNNLATGPTPMEAPPLRTAVGAQEIAS